MKTKELKQVKTIKKFKNVDSAIKAFNMVINSKLALKGELNFGTLVFTLGDKVVRVHEFAAQVNELLIIRHMSNEIHLHYQWENQFREAAYNAGYQYADRHEHVAYLADFHPEMKDIRSYAVVNGKRVDVDTDICKLCSLWSICSFNEDRCGILS